MTIASAYPELNQPLPRYVRTRLVFYVCILVLTFAFLFFIPILGLTLRQTYNPTISAKNYEVLALLSVAATTIYLAVMFYLLWEYFKERKILRWGNVAMATVVEGLEVSTGKGGRYMPVEYGFEDANGNLIEGTRRFPAQSQVKWSGRGETLKYLDHPVALYDPKNSDKNILYPGYYFAVCSRPKSS